MVRVLATIMHSEYAGSLKRQQVDLTNWIREIHLGMYRHLVSNLAGDIYIGRPASYPRHIVTSSRTIHISFVIMPTTTRHSTMLPLQR